MPTTQALFYFDNTTLADSNSIYTDATLTSVAADGYYSDGVIIRQLLGGILQPPIICPSCGLSCNDGSINFNNTPNPQPGLYEMVFNTTSVGAILIHVKPTGSDFPMGIVAIIDGGAVATQKLSCNHDNSNPSLNLISPSFIGSPSTPVFFGDASQANACGFPFPPLSTLNVNLQNYYWDIGTSSFITPATTTNFNIEDYMGDHTLGLNPLVPLIGADPPGAWMVLPRTVIDSNAIRMYVYAYCGGSGNPMFDIDVYCPMILPYVSTSQVFANELDACSATVDDQMFYVSVSQGVTPPPIPELGINDWVFTDAYGQGYAPDGFYKAIFVPPACPTGCVIQVSNGRVIAITGC